MTIRTVNVGLVKAIFVGTTAPTNTNVLWRDTSLNPPLHKYYNTTTSSWETFIYSTLIDNVTIKKDVDGKLYVDLTEIPALSIEDGSILLVKLEDVASGTVFYRKTAGDGAPEIQTLAVLKEDLGLQGTNTGDQDLSGYVLKITTINGKALTGNISLTPSDIGSPTGSGTSTGTNTGDETLETILSKLGITVLSGENTGDQIASTVPILDVDELYDAENVEDALKEVKEIADEAYSIAIQSARVIPIYLPAYAAVNQRCSNAVEGTDYPNGWVLSTGASEYDLKIVHGLSKNIVDVKVFEINADTTERMLPSFSAAYTGLLQNSTNEILVEGLTQDLLPLRLELILR